MYLLYVDASGTADIPGDLAHYALIGVCVHERKWYAIEKRVAGLKRQFTLQGTPGFELHAKDICVDYREQRSIEGFDAMDFQARRIAVAAARQERLGRLTGAEAAKRRTHYAKTDGLIHLTRSERTRLYEAALDLIGDHDGLRLFGEVIDKRTPITATQGAAFFDSESVVRSSFTQIVTRFEAFLRRQHTYTRRHEKGMIVMDNDPPHAERMTRLMKKFRAIGHPWGEIRYVIEAPFFIDSQVAVGIQLADIASYCVRRYVERAGQGRCFEEENFRRIFRKFDREGASLHGLRHYCQRGACPCMICADRGHSSKEPVASIITPSTEPSLASSTLVAPESTAPSVPGRLIGPADNTNPRSEE